MNTFSLTDDQVIKVEKWRKEHECKLRTDEHGIEGESYVGAIGGALTYYFTPTGIGTSEVVKCACGEKLDLTDYDLW